MSPLVQVVARRAFHGLAKTPMAQVCKRFFFGGWRMKQTTLFLTWWLRVYDIVCQV